MTTPTPGATGAARERLLSLLPVHVRARDSATDPLLHALLGAVAGELAVLEADLAELEASWFVETCPEWVVPYLGDLLGVVDLPPEPPSGTAAGAGVPASRRAVVANTVAYRRRKGTVAVLEQAARDVTGWPCRAVEYFRLLAATTHLDHVRADRPATASLRGAARLDLTSPAVASGALDPLAHTAEVRRAASGRGRYGIPNVGVFLFSTQVYEVRASAARSSPDGWTAHPLGVDSPLFAVPSDEQAIERLAGESDLPVPLRPRRLLELLEAARENDDVTLPVAVRVDDETALPPAQVRVCGLEDLAVDREGKPVPGWQVFVDTVRGRLHPYRDGAPQEPSSMHVDFSYGGIADVGAGTYDRSETHAAQLEDDPYAGDPERGGPGVVAQVAVRAPDSLAGALADAAAAWAAPGGPVGATYVLCVADSATHGGPLAIHVPARTRLVLVAASWRSRVLGNGDVLPPPLGVYAPEGLRPHLRSDVVLSGEVGSSVVLDGLVVEGDVVVEAGDLGTLSVGQCTVSGRVRVEADAAGPNRALEVSVDRSVAGGVDLAPTVPRLTLRDSVVDAGPAPAPLLAVSAPGAHLAAEGSTARGDVRVRSMDASSCLLDGTVAAEHRQTGCVRYSYVGPGSRVPRRFRCVPSSDTAAAPRPVYVSDRPGSPDYLALDPACPQVVAEGGEGGTEMGAHAHLQRPLRLSAARRLLGPYLPVGLEIGLGRS